MLEEIWQHTETVLAILVFVGIVAVCLGTLYCMGLWICDILKLNSKVQVPYIPKKRSAMRQHYRLPPMERVPRRHKPGHRRSASMNEYDGTCGNGYQPIHNSSLDSCCPGPGDD